MHLCTHMQLLRHRVAYLVPYHTMHRGSFKSHEPCSSFVPYLVRYCSVAHPTCSQVGKPVQDVYLDVYLGCLGPVQDVYLGHQAVPDFLMPAMAFVLIHFFATEVQPANIGSSSLVW